MPNTCFLSHAQRNGRFGSMVGRTTVSRMSSAFSESALNRADGSQAGAMEAGSCSLA